jgi:hypothetical protein
VAGNDCAIGGEVGRDVFAAGDSLELSGRGARDVSLHGSDVGFLPSANYPGAIELHMPEGAEADVDPGATLGQTTRKLLDDEHGPVKPIRRFTQLERLRGHLVTVVAAFLVGLVLFALTPGLFDTRVESVGRFFLSIGVGFVSFTALLAAIALSAVSVIGIPLAIVLALFMVALIFVGPIVVAAVVGRTVMRSESIAFRDFALALGVGTLLLGILTGLPGVGGFALFVLVLEGVGLLTLDAFDWWQRRRAAGLASADVPA